MKKLLVVAWSFGLLSIGAWAQQPADLVLLNGRVFTSDPARPQAQTLAIRGERIVAVGSTAEITRLAGPNTRRLDVQGRTITPGFNDAYNHFSPDAPGVHLTFKTMEPSWDETAQALTAAAAKAPAGTWLFGSMGATVILNEQVNRAALDQLPPATRCCCAPTTATASLPIRWGCRNSTSPTSNSTHWAATSSIRPLTQRN